MSRITAKQFHRLLGIQQRINYYCQQGIEYGDLRDLELIRVEYEEAIKYPEFATNQQIQQYQQIQGMV